MNSIDISHITIPFDFNQITDFYIPEEGFKYSIMYPGPKFLISSVEYEDIIKLILEEAQKKEKLEFALEFVHNKKRIIFRGHSIKSIEGRVFIIRRLPSVVPKIEELGISPQILEILLSEKLNSGGLIIISGETGQGKSTTAAALVSYRLRNFGSFCLTIEDPIEMPLQGFYQNEQDRSKKGVCFQTSITNDFTLEEALKSSLRCYPAISNSILYVGEMRDANTANEILKIAANGHLVVTTMHGSDIVVSLKRFLNLAISDTNANTEEIKSLFSSVFKLIIHQKMEVFNGKRKLKQSILFSNFPSSVVATRLKTGNMEVLATEIQNQNMMIAKGQSLFGKD